MINLEDYDYLLPEKNLALEPAMPRDSSKLFIYDTIVDKIIFDSFSNLDKYLPKNSFLVLNNTKVLPARVTMKKQTGGKIVTLFLINELTESQIVKVIVDRKVNVGDRLFFDDGNYIDCISQKENIFEFKFNFPKEKLFLLLQKFGVMPIPPYLKGSPLKRDELLEKYQTVFAKMTPLRCKYKLASSAAPTASLHFTDSVFDKLKQKGIEKTFVTLHVGLGTFAPINEANIKQKKLHEEYYEVNKKTLQKINKLRKEGKKLVGVGTTVVRTLESIDCGSATRFFSHKSLTSSSRGPLESEKKLLLPHQSIYGKTDLFIFPPYDFKLVDVMITNFHLPKSSLMMLVEAFLQHKKAKRSLVELYNIAIKNNFRFYSFGDAMLII